MKALVSKIEPRFDGFRVIQTCEDDAIFETTEDFIWVDCDDSVQADLFWYDLNQNLFNKIEFVAQSEVTKEQLLKQLLAIQEQLDALK